MLGIAYNPHSKKGATLDRMNHILELLEAEGIQYIFEKSSKPKEIIDISRKLAETCDTVIAAGGDGTIFEVINGTFGSGVKMGVFPLGSGNDIARSLGVHEYSDEDLVEMIKRDDSRDYDIGYVNDSMYMGQFAAYGLVSSIIARYDNKEKAGSMGYYGSILSAAIHHRPVKYKVIVDGGEELNVKSDYISVHNTKTAGSGMLLCKDAVDNDGIYNLLIVNNVGFFRMIANGVALMKGNISKQPNITMIEVKESAEIIPDKPHVMCVDGELMETDHISFKNINGKIRFIH